MSWLDTTLANSVTNFGVASTAYGADKTGASDSRAAIQSAFAAASDVFHASGIYLINTGTVGVDGKAHWFEEGALLKVGTGQAVVLAGTIKAAAMQRIVDVSASSCTLVIATPQRISPQWFGASSMAALPANVTFTQHDHSVNGAPTMVSARSFCPPNLLTHFGKLSPSAARPYLLTDAYASLAAAQVDFPWLVSVDYSGAKSLDWAVIQSAVRWGEALAGYNATVWLDHGAYGIIGTITVHGGVSIIGQAASGSSSNTGTAIVHFDTGDCFYFKGDADPLGVGGFSGAGSGVRNVSIVKANRLAWSGSSYQGGIALHFEAQSLAKRPSEVSLENVLIYGEGSAGAGAATWDKGIFVDGANARTPGNAGIRNVHLRKVRAAGATTQFKTIHIRGGTHVQGFHVQTDQATASVTDGIWIEAQTQNVSLDGVVSDGVITIDDGDVVSISGVTNTNPMVVTTSTPHGIPVGQQANVYIEGVGGCTAANGHWNGIVDNNAITSLSPTTFSIPSAGNGAYTSGGTVRAESPKDVHIRGRCSEVNVTSEFATGVIETSHGWFPSKAVSGISVLNHSRKMRVLGPYAPKFVYREDNLTQASVTGDGTVYNVQFRYLDVDDNDDALGVSSPYSYFQAHVAGEYDMRARVLLQGIVAGTHTRASIRFHVLDGSGNFLAYHTAAVLIPTAFGDPQGTMSVQIAERIALNYQDVVRVELWVDGAAAGTKTVNVVADSGSGYVLWTGELV